jgi:hypothetical protein
MALGSERGTVQNPFLRYAVEAGWTYLSPDDALRLRPGPTSPVLFPVLVQQLQKLNPGVVDQRRAEDPSASRLPGNISAVPEPVHRRGVQFRSCAGRPCCPPLSVVLRAGTQLVLAVRCK